MKEKKVIGRTECVDFPDLEINQLQAKIDTGAYTSALHCSYIREIDGKLHFIIQHSKSETQLEKEFVVETFKKRKITSSNGRSQVRQIIKTHVLLGGKVYNTEFSLTDRSKLKNPVLIGRKALKDKFLVDVSKKFLFKKSKQK